MEQEQQPHSQKNATADAQENAPLPPAPEEAKKQNKAVAFFADILRGVGIGVAFIIPGFSGGSVAAILGIYEKLVGAIADIFKHFKKSVLTLLPILIGMLLGIAALIYPIQLGLKHFPIPTVSLFVGLALGGIPSVTEKMRGGRVSWKHILAFAIPLVAAAALCFLPLAGDVDLFSLNAWGYLLLVVVGAVGSCALVVPGISGSMLLLIFGYYNPVVGMITGNLLHGQEVGTCLAVLACLAVGVVIGFFAISVLMKFCLKRAPRGTHFAILGFILGSIPAVFVSTLRESHWNAQLENASRLSALMHSPWYWVVAAALLLAGFALSFCFVWFARKKKKESEISEP